MRFSVGEYKNQLIYVLFPNLDVTTGTQVNTEEVREVKLGYPPPNPILKTTDGKRDVPLLAVENPGRPLVVNFGSCT